MSDDINSSIETVLAPVSLQIAKTLAGVLESVITNTGSRSRTILSFLSELADKSDMSCVIGATGRPNRMHAIYTEYHLYPRSRHTPTGRWRFLLLLVELILSIIALDKISEVARSSSKVCVTGSEPSRESRQASANGVLAA
jgi:hypothetical protein